MPNPFVPGGGAPSAGAQPTPVSPYPGSGTAPDETAISGAVGKAVEQIKLVVKAAVKMQPAIAQQIMAAVSNAIQEAQQEAKQEGGNKPQSMSAPPGAEGPSAGSAPSKMGGGGMDVGSMYR